MRSCMMHLFWISFIICGNFFLRFTFKRGFFIKEIKLFKESNTLKLFKLGFILIFLEFD